MTATDTVSRSDAIKQAHDKKLRSLFEGKKFDVIKEIKLEGDQRFMTPFGNKGRHGFAVREQGNPTNQFIVGAAVLRVAAERFGAVELPEKRQRRTPEQKAADDAAKAAERQRLLAEQTAALIDAS